MRSPSCPHCARPLRQVSAVLAANASGDIPLRAVFSLIHPRPEIFGAQFGKCGMRLPRSPFGSIKMAGMPSIAALPAGPARVRSCRCRSFRPSSHAWSGLWHHRGADCRSLRPMRPQLAYLDKTLPVFQKPVCHPFPKIPLPMRRFSFTVPHSYFVSAGSPRSGEITRVIMSKNWMGVCTVIGLTAVAAMRCGAADGAWKSPSTGA